MPPWKQYPWLHHLTKLFVHRCFYHEVNSLQHLSLSDWLAAAHFYFIEQEKIKCFQYLNSGWTWLLASIVPSMDQDPESLPLSFHNVESHCATWLSFCISLLTVFRILFHVVHIALFIPLALRVFITMTPGTCVANGKNVTWLLNRERL